ncbi:ANTAR domain-containing response regulator [Grimontia marina]|uniref:Putative transcriptional regulatory protein pdtaR n=1 Tax=Grimontia marina TaxID=646534 RepID=A0A128FH25_9GAMM|nr:ANTAR domain-containing protein [Grimontia marina]CZF86103.1 putative transcriptional regulatory protein pdtaR [Grimontia marina]
MKRPSMSINRFTVISDDDRACSQIAKASERMGIECHLSAHLDNDSTSTKPIDLFLIDILHYFNDVKVQGTIPSTTPIVGLIAHGSPVEIERAISIGAMSVVVKPINQTSLYAAFHTAMKLFQHHEQMRLELETLRLRQKLRPIVIEAVIGIMEKYRVPEPVAYTRLRKYSMQRNVPLEQVCLELSQGNISFARVNGED